MIQLSADWPLRVGGTKKFIGTDLKMRNGDLVFNSAANDLETVSGVYALAQSIELAVKRVSGVPPSEMVKQLLDRIRSGEYAQYIDALHVVRHDGSDIEFEFSAAGYPGAYVHRFQIRGFAGAYECIPVRKEDLLLVDTVDRQLLEELRRHPEKLHELTPRRFEEVVAHLIENMGYEVELTRYSKDDGVDIFALRRDGLSPILTVIDCKKYSENRPIGVSLIRTLAGLRQQHKANVGMIATTARFTQDAKDLQAKEWRFELALADFELLREWLERFGWSRDGGGLWLPNQAK
jgi:HJR/Mrr/RecB family endonuclease